MPVTIDYSYTTEFSFGYVDRTTPAFSLTDNMPTTIANLDFMVESGDADLDPITA